MKNMIHVARQRLFTGKTDLPKITERQPALIIIPALIVELGNPHEAINAQTTTSHLLINTLIRLFCFLVIKTG